MFGDSGLDDLKCNGIQGGKLKGRLTIMTKYLWFNKCSSCLWKQNTEEKLEEIEVVKA